MGQQEERIRTFSRRAGGVDPALEFERLPVGDFALEPDGEARRSFGVSLHAAYPFRFAGGSKAIPDRRTVMERRDDGSVLQEVRTRFHRKGRRMTAQRTAILEALRSTRTHPTANELLGLVARMQPRMSLGTIYRNLTMLVEEGYALRLSRGDGPCRYDGDTSRHHHVVCDGCGQVADVFLARAPELLRRVADLTGWEVHPTEMLFSGRCPSCARAAGQEEI
jgi:Fe2+ or Zn2+ uptake regulation protein